MSFNSHKQFEERRELPVAQPSAEEEQELLGVAGWPVEPPGVQHLYHQEPHSWQQPGSSGPAQPGGEAAAAAAWLEEAAAYGWAETDGVPDRR